MATIKKKITGFGEVIGKLEPLYTIGGVQMVSLYGK